MTMQTITFINLSLTARTVSPFFVAVVVGSGRAPQFVVNACASVPSATVVILVLVGKGGRARLAVTVASAHHTFVQTSAVFASTVTVAKGRTLHT